MPQNIFENVTVYTTGNNPNFNKNYAQAVATLEDLPNGNTLTITADPENAHTALVDGINYFWVIAEINCARSAKATFSLASITAIDITGAAGTPFNRQNFSFKNGQKWPEDTVNFNVMTAQERYPARVCATKEDNNYPVLLSENVEKIE